MAHPPWHLSGELLLAWVRRPSSARWRRSRLPDGVASLPGPALVVAASYSASPIGPFTELSVAEPARLGLRPGFCVTTSVVAAAECRIDYRLNWGVPAEVGALLWEVDGAGVRRLRWLDCGLEIAGRPSPVRVPAWIPHRSVQRRSDGAVLVPRRVRGWVRPTVVGIRVAAEDEALSWLAGPHVGAVVTGMRMVVDPARQPFGLLSSLRAPLRAPGTGLTASVVPESAGASARVTAPRAYGSVG